VIHPAESNLNEKQSCLARGRRCVFGAAPDDEAWGWRRTAHLVFSTVDEELSYIVRMFEHCEPQALLNWEAELDRRLPLFGHRNWIVIADSAYPEQSKPGIATIAAGGDQLDAVRTALDRIAACKHIKANVYIDLELGFVEEEDAPGIGEYRQRLDLLLNGANCKQLPHEQIIAKLDECAQRFNILIIKTDLDIPYTSVFFELECGYWSVEAEERLRKAMERSKPTVEG
jgi:hypothetical protein